MDTKGQKQLSNSLSGNGGEAPSYTMTTPQASTGYVLIYASNPGIPWDDISARLFLWKVSVGPITPIHCDDMEIENDNDIVLLTDYARLYLYDDPECPRGNVKVPAILVRNEFTLEQLEGKIDRALNR